MSGKADSARLVPARHLSGRGKIIQQGDELCWVTFELTESMRTSPDRTLNFEGALSLIAGILLDVGMPDLVLELPDGRRIDIQITAVDSTGRQETYLVRGNLIVAVRANTR